MSRIVKYNNGDIHYLNDSGLHHKTDGPAVECANGSKFWYLNGQLHRVDGPAIEFANGDKFWYLNDQFHRVDGPAIEYVSGIKKWWYEGKQIECFTQEQFDKLIKLRFYW